GNAVGTIAPQATAYQPFSIRFTVAAGTYQITLQGTQASGSSVLLDELALNPAPTVTAPGPPELAAIPAQSVDEGTRVSFTASASGFPSPPPYSLDPNAPAGAVIDPSTGVFTWPPTAPGTYSVTIRATGGGSPTPTASR